MLIIIKETAIFSLQNLYQNQRKKSSESLTEGENYHFVCTLGVGGCRHWRGNLRDPEGLIRWRRTLASGTTSSTSSRQYKSIGMTEIHGSLPQIVSLVGTEGRQGNIISQPRDLTLTHTHQSVVDTHPGP